MRPRSSCAVLRLFALSLPWAPLTAQLQVGDPAPPILASTWLNHDGEAPTLERLRGRAVLLEFWGTWCAPCVRAMPGIQKLHERYRDRGLTVLAISYEDAATMRPFLQQHAYTMPVGADPEKRTIGAYPVNGWPTTVVIDKEGKVAHIGSPYDAEAAVEKVLGLEAGPAALLGIWLDSQRGTKDAQRAALQRLGEKAPADFDLQSWARGHLPPEVASAPGAEPAKAATPAALSAAESLDVLQRCAKAWTDAAARRPLLQTLGERGPRTFDLASFARDAFGKAFPLDGNELKTLLQDKKYGEAVTAIAQRTPSAQVLATATRHKDLAAYCKSKHAECRAMARKGLMAQLWVFPGALPKDAKLNEAFWADLSVSGMATSPDRKSITGILLGGEQVQATQVDAFVHEQLASWLLMTDLAAGKPPRLRELAALVAKERTTLVRELEGRYGKPEPVPGK